MNGSGTRQVDPWRFTGSLLTRILSSGIPAEPAHPPIPWTPVTKPLSASKIALLKSRRG